MGSYTLRDYLQGSDKPFSWGEHHCLSFVSGALEAMGKEPLPSDWLSEVKTPREAMKLYNKVKKGHRSSDIIEELDRLYEREVTLSPQDGLIVARKSGDVLGYSFGVTFSTRCVFVGIEGLVIDPPRITDKFWMP